MLPESLHMCTFQVAQTYTCARQVAGKSTHVKSLDSIHVSSRLKVYTRRVSGKYTHVKSLESIHTSSRWKVYTRQVA